MEFNIEIYRNVGPLFFGMNQQQVIQVLGHVDRTNNSDPDIVKIHCLPYSLLAHIRRDTDQLCEVGFGHRASNVRLDGIHFFEHPPLQVIQNLLARDSTAKAGSGSIVFPMLGISLTGFQTCDDNSRTMTVFVEGYWDSVLPGMAPFKM